MAVSVGDGEDVRRVATLRAWKTTLEFFGAHLGIAEGHACPDECRRA
ncbi:MAG: hypothetical protein ABF614_04700 [Bifidobacterium psychraerophilum]